MIDDKTKHKLLKELEKSGNVFLSCLKTGIDRSTYYRWFEADKEFRKFAGQAIRRGKENNCDIAKHALMIRVKEKDMRAIEYVLGHNDPVYKRKQSSNVVILHKKGVDNQVMKETFEEYESRLEKEDREKAIEVYNGLITYYRKIPNKPDGTPIWLHEFSKYSEYMRDWCILDNRKKEKIGLTWRELKYYDSRAMSFERFEELIDTVDSEPEKDKPPEAPPENQIPSNNSDSGSATPDRKPDNNT